MLKFPYENHLTNEEFEENSGYRIIDRLNLADEVNEDVAVKHFLKECAGMVYQYISLFQNADFAKEIYASTDENIIEILTLAEYYQTLYIFENGGSLGALNGSDNFVSLSELRGNRDYSPMMISTLENAGLTYCGVK